MKLTKQRLKEIIKEELLRERFLDLTETARKELPARVHAKAKTLESEGYPKDQAYAVAISMVGIKEDEEK